MPFILRKSPFFNERTFVVVPDGQQLTILHDQIVVWISVTPAGLEQFPNDAPRIPAIFDSGFNDNFLIQRCQLVEWTGVDLREFPPVGSLRWGKRSIALCDADIWLHCNRAGKRDDLIPRRSFRLELRSGIGISDIDDVPRLPLLGNLALRRARLIASIDYNDCHISLRTTTTN